MLSGFIADKAELTGPWSVEIWNSVEESARKNEEMVAIKILCAVQHVVVISSCVKDKRHQSTDPRGRISVRSTGLTYSGIYSIAKERSTTMAYLLPRGNPIRPLGPNRVLFSYLISVCSRLSLRAIKDVSPTDK